MRAAGGVLVPSLLLLALLAGCLGGDEAPELPPLTFEGGEPRARDAAAGQAGDDVRLVAAFGVAAGDPGRLGVSGAFPGMAEVAARVLAAPAPFPADGTLPAWGYLYEPADGSELLGAVVSGATTAGGNGLAAAEGGDIWVRDGAIARAELQLLRANGTLAQAPDVDSRGAIEAALADPQWAAVAESDDAFVLFVLAALDDGSPEWRLVASPYDAAENGTMARIDGVTGALKSLQPWPPAGPPMQQGDFGSVGLRVAVADVVGEYQAYTLTVPGQGAAALHVRPGRTATGPVPPRVELVSPAGDRDELTLGEVHTADEPAPGEWQVVFTWELPDLYRSIRVDSCVEPPPFLFGERDGLCTLPDA